MTPLSKKFSITIAKKRIWEAERIGWAALAESWRKTLADLEAGKPYRHVSKQMAKGGIMGDLVTPDGQLKITISKNE